MKKQHYICIVILAILPIILILITMSQNQIFASQVDYLSQHLSVPEYLRTLFYDSGNLFPDYAPHLQGGTNIYSFSYYGLFRPDVLLSYALPMLSMKSILIVYSVFLIALGSNALFIWLHKKGFDYKLCLFAAIVYTCSSVFFHSHRQIMFVNFLPFLILALLSIDYYFKTKKLTYFTICLVLIILHSYFFSIAAIIICIIYFALEANHTTQNKKMYLHLFASVAIAISICAILLLPTAQVILANKKSVASTSLTDFFIPNLSLQGLLYDPYGCGLLMISWASILLGLNHTKTKKLSWILIACFTLPCITYLLNGALYIRYKILLVCLPLVLYQMCNVLTLRYKKQLPIAWYMYLGMCIPLLFVENKLFAAVDIVFTIIILLLLTSPKKMIVLIPYCAIVFTQLHLTNPTSTYLDKTLYDNVHNKSKQQLITRNIKNERLYDFSDNFQSSNFVPNTNIYKMSSYTSTNNSHYNTYLYDVMNAPISIANRTANLDNSHIFLQSMLGIKNIITTNKVPVGYTCSDKQGKYNYCRNEDVMPIAYATNQTINQQDFQKLSFPYTLDTIHNTAITQQTNTQYPSQIEAVQTSSKLIKESKNITYKKVANGYQINAKKKSKIQVDLQLEHPKQITIVVFDVETIKNKQTSETSISINGIKNKLSKGDAAYPNNNTNFVYVLSSQENSDILDITLDKGIYEIKNTKIYTLDYATIQKQHEKVDALTMNENTQNQIINGDINVKNENSYFITSIPYEKGYQAYIDGKQVKMEKVNTAFIGFPITQGKHHIEIIFNAPYKKVASIVSIMGTLLLGLQIMVERRKKDA